MMSPDGDDQPNLSPSEIYKITELSNKIPMAEHKQVFYFKV